MAIENYSINFKSNLKELDKKIRSTQHAISSLSEKKIKLEADSSRLAKMRKEIQGITLEQQNLRQQKTEIKLGNTDIKDTALAMRMIDRQINRLNSKKISIEEDIKPIKDVNAELRKTEKEIKSIKSQKINIDFGNASQKLDNFSKKIFGVVKAIGGLSLAGLSGGVAILKQAVTEAGRLEQNIGGVNKLFDKSAGDVIKNAKGGYKNAGVSQNEYLEQATTLSASLISQLEKGKAKTTGGGDKDALKKRKEEIKKQIKEQRLLQEQESLNNNAMRNKEAKKEAKENLRISRLKGKEAKKEARENLRISRLESKEAKTKAKENQGNVKQNVLELKKNMAEIDEAIKNAPKKETVYVDKLTKEEAQQKASTLINTAVTDMSDNANTFGTDLNLLQNAYQGFAKGTYTMLDNFQIGFSGNQKEAMRLVNDYGGLDEKVTDISQVTLPLMIKSIHNVQEAMKISGTTAKEASATYEGSFNTMKKAWENFLATGDTNGLADSVGIYLDNLDDKLKELTPKIINGLKEVVKEVSPRINPILKDLGVLISESLDSIFGEGFSKNFTDGMKPITDVVTGVFKAITGATGGEAPDLSKLGGVIPGLLKFAIGMKAVSVAFKGIDIAKNFMPNLGSFGGIGKLSGSMKSVGIEDLKSLGLKMLTVAGISANIYIAAKALQEVKNVGDFGELKSKLLSIGVAVVGMGVIVFAVDKLMKMTGGAPIAGLFVIAGIAGDIYFMAKALQEVDKINSDFGAVQAKIGQIALVVTEIGLLAGVVGLAMSTGVVALAEGIGLATLTAIAWSLGEMAEAVSSVSNLDLDKKKIKNNIETIKEVVDSIGGKGLIESLGSFLEGLGGSLDYGVATVKIKEIYEIGKVLEKIKNLSLSDEKQKILDNIGVVDEAIKSISNFATDDIVNNLGGMAEALAEITNMITRSYPPKFKELGKLLAKNMTDEFYKNIKIYERYKNNVNKIKASAGSDLGKKLAENMNKAFSDKINIGASIRRQINEALKGGYTATILFADLKKTSSIFGNAKITAMAEGGVVRGKNDSPIQVGNDKNLTLLQNGEYVMPEKRVKQFRKGFFDDLRQGRIPNYLSKLGDSISKKEGAITNYYNNTTTSNNQDIKVFTQGGSDVLLRANRQLRGI